LTTSDLFEKVNDRLKEFFDDERPFGGLGVILMGDFYQIPAIGHSLLSALHEPASIGGRLFLGFKMISLHANMRAVDDVTHQTYLRFFREPRLGLTPLLTSGILRSLKVLTAEDIRDDKSWLDAVIVVTENTKRRALNLAQALRFAKRSGAPVIAWRNKLESNTAAAFQACAIKNGIEMTSLIDQHSELISLFIVGAPAMLHDNHCPAKGLSNG
jgi:hypothetical protein